MNLANLARIFQAPTLEPTPTAPERPQGAAPAPGPAGMPPDPPGWLQAREERAAILEHEAGLDRAAAETEAARLHPDPATLQALATALHINAQRERGERPKHYTRRAFCDHCGPVWLPEGGPVRVRGCPWCLTPPGVAIPRPPVRCGTCRHFQPDPDNPAAALGACTLDALASQRGAPLWPEATRPCGDWRPVPKHQPKEQNA